MIIIIIIALVVHTFNIMSFSNDGQKEDEREKKMSKTVAQVTTLGGMKQTILHAFFLASQRFLRELRLAMHFPFWMFLDADTVWLACFIGGGGGAQKIYHVCPALFMGCF